MHEKIDNGKLLELCNVLHISDDSSEAKVMNTFLSSHVKKAYTANCSEEGIKSFFCYRPDIVILDLKISNEINIETLKKLREIDENSIVILTTSTQQSEFFITAISQNINSFLLKPVEKGRLLNVLYDSAVLIHSRFQNKYYETYEQKIIDKQSNMILILNEEFDIKRANAKFFETFEVESIEEFSKRYSKEDIILDCKIYHDFLSKLDTKTIIDIVDHPKNKYVSTIIDLPNYDVRAFLINGSRERNDRGDVEYILSFADITAYEIEKRKIEKSSHIDPLTKIHNRYIFEELFKYELNMKKRYSQPSSLIFFDVDDFKSINDTYGHNVGDEVLSAIAIFFKKKIRGVDSFIRWGGEEFIILLPYTNKKEALDLADRVRIELSEKTFEHDIKITCSFGVTEIDEEDTYLSFIERADKAQYKAKSTGKNRVFYM
ncbi:GGDEF domain-containing response regulator [Sulfurospirillum arcachonense]|uniref:GGDEF domain-containing response regulator n=1 Tax=Sulfurospirillum arcachonense TaxID=57666 RepID=UPI0004690FD8|nr:GGDEF domain-containing response regulator [Sulfurospirillum arcachonense]